MLSQQSRASSVIVPSSPTPGNDTLIGTEGDDTLHGLEGDDSIYGRGGADLLYGDAGTDVLIGGDGDDRLNGGTGADTMIGGLGSDWYYVDDLGDTITEASDAGIFDRILTAIDFTIPTDLSIEIMSTTNHAGTAAIALTGNNLANDLIGNAGANLIKGMEGDDDLEGNEGDDRLEGGEGNDNLFGGSGANQLVGGSGNDDYYITSSADIVVEGLGEGTIDRIFTTVSYVLTAGAYIERFETLDPASLSALQLTGNELGNSIWGNAGANYLFGMAGSDILTGLGGDDRLDGGSGVDDMAGGLGNDWYYVDHIDDYIVELAGQGVDRILSAISFRIPTGMDIETISTTNNDGTGALDLTGNEIGNNVWGNAGANRLRGMEGDDSIHGHGGADRMEGGAGADEFLYLQLWESTATASDIIFDLEAADVINLSALDANSIAAGNQDFTRVSVFSHTPGELTVTYNATQDRTFVQADVDGDGQADFRIVLYGDHRTYDNFLGVI